PARQGAQVDLTADRPVDADHRVLADLDVIEQVLDDGLAEALALGSLARRAPADDLLAARLAPLPDLIPARERRCARILEFVQIAGRGAECTRLVFGLHRSLS